MKTATIGFEEYKIGVHGFTYRLSDGAWYRSAKTVEEIKKAIKRREADAAIKASKDEKKNWRFGQ